MKRSIKNLSLGLALVLGLAACSTPNSTGNNQTNQNNSQQTSLVASSQATSDLSSYNDDETTFSDSEKLAAQDSGFATKALTDILADKKADKAEQAKSNDKSEVKVNMKARLDASGAFTKTADGKMILDNDKLKATVKQFIADNKTEIKADIEKIKDKLQDKKEVAKEKAEKLKNKKAKAKTSNVVSVTNADGSITKTMSVELKTENMTKENIVSKTTLNGKMLTMTHTLKITAKAFTKDATRIMTFNDDGSKKVVTESVTTYTNGRKREIHETRDIAANGSGSGNGTISTTDKDGKTTTKTLDTKVTTSVSGDEKVTSTETDGNKTVTLNENASGTATIAIKEGDKPAETADIDVEAKEEASAS